MQAWILDNTITHFRLVCEERPMPAPKAGELLIKTHFAALNRADIFQLQGQYPLPEETGMIPGMECSGTVEQVSADVEGFRPGERVMALMTGGAYAEYCAVPAAQCVRLPETVSFETGAALAEALATVWLALFRTAHFNKGESVLIHGGGSGIGTTAIQIVKLWGGTPIITAGSPEKCDACTALGAESINYATEDFVTRVKDLTGGRGVDIVIDIVGGEYIEKNLKCLAPGGRMVSLSFIKGAKVTANVAGLLMKNLQWNGVTLRSQSTEIKHEILSSIERDLFPHLLAGRFGPVIDRVFPAREVEKAHKRMQESLHLGKILLDMRAF